MRNNMAEDINTQPIDESRLNRYVKMANRVRELSSPLLTGLSNAEEYRVHLLEELEQTT